MWQILFLNPCQFLYFFLDCVKSQVRSLLRSLPLGVSLHLTHYLDLLLEEMRILELVADFGVRYVKRKSNSGTECVKEVRCQMSTGPVTPVRE